MNRGFVVRRIAFIALFFGVSVSVILSNSGVLGRELRDPVTNLTPSVMDAIPISPAYDSGWQSFSIRPDPITLTLNHSLGGDPDDYLVDLQCRDDSELSTFGCDDLLFSIDAHWYALTETSIKVWIKSGDDPNAVRLRIYLPTPAFDSGWQVFGSRPDPIPFQIDLPQITNPDNYWVSIECKDDAPLNTYDCTDHGFNINAQWYAFVTNSITLWVQRSPRPDEIRLRLYQMDADYDSGWYPIGPRPDPLPVSFPHNLRGNPDDYLVNLQCKDDLFDTYGCADFNFVINALWYNLTDTSIEVWVASASRPDRIRIQIVSPDKAFLPAAMKN